jgi:mannose-6-phosphate isomerase class I
MEVEPRFLRNSKLKPTDVYFVPADSTHADRVSQFN